jgi:hypothetical protein
MPLHLDLPSRKDARFILRVSGCGWGTSKYLDSVETTGASHARLRRAIEALALPSQKEAAIRPGGRQISLRNEFFRLAERSTGSDEDLHRGAVCPQARAFVPGV